ncbi:MAG: cyclic nucleotide-binding domain-containing protein [Pseudomonadota bacterium]
MLLTTGLTGRHQSHVATSQEKAALFLFPFATSLSAGTLPLDTAAGTLLAAYVVVALLSGLFCVLLAQLNAERFLNYLPGSVVRGLFAAVGSGLVVTALRLSYGADAGSSIVAALAALAVAAVFWGAFLSRISLLWPVAVVFAAAVAFPLAGGAWPPGWLLLDTAHSVTFAPTLSVSALLDAAPEILSAACITAVAAVGGVALFSGHGVRNRELRAIGFGNLAAACVGGASGHTAAGPSQMFVGKSTTPKPAIVIGVAVLMLAFVSPVLARSTPVPLAYGFLIFLGLILLNGTVVKPWRMMRPGDRAVALVMAGSAPIVGLPATLGIGLLSALALLIVRAAQLDPVAAQGLGVSSISNARRPATHAQILDKATPELAFVQLRGYLVFAHRDRLSKEAESLRLQGRPKRLVLDVSDVTGFDLHPDEIIAAFLECLGPELELYIASKTRWDAPEHVRFFATAQDAAFHAEEACLANSVKEPAADLPPSLKALAEFGEVRKLSPGDTIIADKARADTLFFLATGIARIDRDGRTQGFASAGVFLGEAALFPGSMRTADVIASTNVTVWAWSQDVLDTLPDALRSDLYQRILKETLYRS